MLNKILMLLVLPLLCGASEMRVPADFEARDFGPFGGQVAVPKGWFFRPEGYYYRATREDRNEGQYETGMWIAMFTKADAKEAKTAALKVIQSKKEHAQRIIREIPEHTFGSFHRIGLETVSEEITLKLGRVYHHVYLFWWREDKPISLSTAFIAPEEEWKEARKICDVMMDLKPIDMNRVKKPNQ